MTDATVIAEIRALEDQRHQAMRDADIATLDRLLSDKLIYTHSNASTDTKASYLQKVQTKFFDYMELKTEQSQIVVSGNAVFVLGRMIARILHNGVERRLNNCTLGVWTKEGGHWKFIAFQPTPIPQPA